MIKNTSISIYIQKLTIWMLFLLILLLLKQNSGFAYERELILEETYQTQEEKQRYQKKEKLNFEDRFGLDFSFGYGYSYAQVLTGIYGPDPTLETYLNQLDMEFSENVGSFRLTASYMVNPRTFTYFGVPFGVVEVQTKAGSELLLDDPEYEFGVGDLFGGVGYLLLPETKTVPSTIINLDINSDTSKYYSLGDGLWDITAGTRISKSLSESFYTFGVASYTERLEKNDIEPGNITGYGGGIGILSDIMRIELGVKTAQIDQTEFNNATLFKDDEDLALNFSVYSLFPGGVDFHFTVGNLDEGMDFERNTFGLEFSIPIL